jgi:MFS family permease
VAGYLLSFLFLALTTGSVAGGWLSDRLGHRKRLLIMAGLVASPAVWLTSRVTNVEQLAALTFTAWFLAALGFVLVSILAGLFAPETERGKVFGILALTNALGLSDRWGYAAMFEVVGLVCAIWPFTALLMLEDRVVPRVRRGVAAGAGERTGLGGSFYLLLLASLIAGVANSTRILGASLALDELGFGAAAISSTGAVGGAVILPLPPLVGWLSDRLGRRRFLALCYLSGTMGLLVMAAAVSLWHFWVGVALVSVLVSVNRGVGSALVTDLVPRAALGTGMSLFGATPFVAGVIGSATAGEAAELWGLTATFILGAFLPLLAIILLIPIRSSRPAEALVPIARRGRRGV